MRATTHSKSDPDHYSGRLGEGITTVLAEDSESFLFQLPVIDASNKTGSMEFACGGNADDFFPVRVSFYSKKSYSEIQVGLSSFHARASFPQK